MNSRLLILAVTLATACERNPPLPPQTTASGSTFTSGTACVPGDITCRCPSQAEHFAEELRCLTSDLTPAELVLVSLHGRTAQFLTDTARVEQTLYPLLDAIARMSPKDKPPACSSFTPGYRGADQFGPRHVFQLTLCAGELDPASDAGMERLATNFSRAEQSLRQAQAAATPAHCPVVDWTSETWWQQRFALVGALEACYGAQSRSLPKERCTYAGARAQRICHLRQHLCSLGRLTQGCQPTAAHCAAAKQVAAGCSAPSPLVSAP